MASQSQPTYEKQRSITAEYAYDQGVSNKNETTSQTPRSDPPRRVIDRKDSDGMYILQIQQLAKYYYCILVERYKKPV